MTERSDLNKLLAQLRAATGADRELDAAIMRLFTSSVESDDGDWWFGPHDQPPQRVPPFTASLDAALTLVPSNAMLVALSDIAADGLPGACLCTDTSTSPPVEHWGVTASRGPERFALALCIAAFEARRAGDEA